MSNRERVAEIDKEIQTLEAEKAGLIVLIKNDEIKDDMSVEERFEIWVGLGGGTVEEPFITDVKAADGSELFMFEEAPLYVRRGVTYEIEEIAEQLVYFMDEEPDTVKDWMQVLMDKDIKSVCVDW